MQKRARLAAVGVLDDEVLLRGKKRAHTLDGQAFGGNDLRVPSKRKYLREMGLAATRGAEQREHMTGPRGPEVDPLHGFPVSRCDQEVIAPKCGAMAEIESKLALLRR